jgi:CHAT domain
METLERCIETVERLRSQSLPEPTKISMLSPKEGPYEDMVVLLCRSLSDGSDVDARALEHAFGYLERAKSRVFVELLAATELGVAELPTDLVEEERRLVRDLRRLQARHRAKAVPLRYDWGAEAAQLEDELRQTHERISESGLRGREYVSLRQASPIDYGGVRNLLSRAEDAAGVAQTGGTETISTGRVVLAEYFTTEDKVFLFVGRSDLNTPEVYQFDAPRDLTWKWRKLVFERLRDPSGWDLSEWQNELSTLIEPLGRWAEEDDIVWLVPHGDLHYLPLHALKVQGRYLIERNPVFYTPSASVMKYCESKGSGRRESALVFGDSLGDLTHAKDEAGMVADLFGVEPYLGDRATKSVVTDSFEEHGGLIDVLHFACHGEFRFAEPLKSCVMLAPPYRDDTKEIRCIEDRDLTAEQILQLEMRAELVTLSACESGVSERHPGDELVGLSRSLIYAGTPSVLASLWRVNDRSTGLLMERFYSDWLDEVPRSESAMTKARALQRAQQQVMGHAGLEHPYYWSPFILVGGWK